MSAPLTPLDDYLTSLGEEQRTRVQEISARVHAMAPDVTEKLSYGIVGYFYKGKALVYAGGWETYVSMYPIPESLLDSEDLPKYQKGKGTLQFPNNEPLPTEFIDAVVAGHLARLS